MYVILIYVAVIALCAYELKTEKSINTKLKYGVFFAVMAVFLIRFNMGSDTKMYMLIFNDVAYNQTMTQAMMYKTMRFPLFSILMFGVHKLGGDFFTFSALLNFTVLPLITYTIYKNSKNVLVSLLIFLSSGVLMVYFTSAMRQVICMSLFFFAYYKYLQNDHYAAYYLCTIPLIFIQEVSLIVLLIPPLYYLRRFVTSKMGYIIFAILSVLVFLSIGYADMFLPTHFAEIFSNKDVSIIGILLQCVLLSIILILYYLADREKLDDKDRFQVFLCVAAFSLYCIFSKNQLASRVSDFIQIVYLILIPNLLAAIPNKKKKAFSFIAVIAVMSVLLTSDFNDTLHTRFFSSSILNYPYITVFNMQDAKYVYAFGDLNVRPE